MEETPHRKVADLSPAQAARGGQSDIPRPPGRPGTEPRLRTTGTASILVADDDPGVLTVTSRALQSDGFGVFTCGNGREAIDLFRSLNPSLVILDVRMPEMDGLTVCRRLRSESDIPIIVLTVLSGESEATQALEAGADDYIRKPFGLAELLARVRAVLRRSRTDVHRAERLTAGPLVIDEREHAVVANGTEIALSRTEFRLLAHLARNQNRVLTHQQMLEHVWGWRYADAHHVLRVAMSRLRAKLGDAGSSIETLAGIGYRLRQKDEPAAASAPGSACL